MNPTAYPLTWPPGWPRTDAARRETSRMQSTLPAALKMLTTEVKRLGGKDLVLSSNCTLGTERPADPGVVAYFKRDGDPVAIPCDRWKTVSENVQAIAKTIDALRGIERWGAKHMVKAAFRGFTALPENASGRTCWQILGLLDARQQTRDSIIAAYRARSPQCHPDTGGSHDAFAELNTAREQALASI